MSYAQLKAFNAVAIEGSFQKAADSLYLTQPAVSVQIKTLEAESGKQLFRRNGHALQLTRDGEALFDSTNRMFRAERDAKSILSSSLHQFRGTLVVGADGPHIALDLIAAFQKRQPAVRVEAVLANAEVTWSNLLGLKVDVAVLAGSPDDPRVSKRPVAVQGLVALLPRGHGLAGRKDVTLERLCAFPLIFREAGSSTQRKLDSALLAEGLSAAPSLVLGSREAVCEAVVRGLGVGFVYDREVGQDPRCFGVKIRGLEKANIDEIACLKGQRSNPNVDVLFACIDRLAG